MPVSITKGNKTALVFGATGLVGRHLIDFLLLNAAYDKVVAFTRKPLEIDHSKFQNHIVDFDELEKYAHLIKGDDLFCCLGTTRRKAGSKAAFKKVDYTYTFQAAKHGALNDVNQFLLVSSVGADANSLFFYLKVKGELEEAVKKLPFWAVHVFRPSFLLGDRPQSRWGEKLAGRMGKGFDRLTGGTLSKYRPVEADVVAKAMVKVAQKFEEGIHVYPSHYLQKLSEEEDKRLRQY